MALLRRRKTAAAPAVPPTTVVHGAGVQIDMAHVVMLYESRDIYDGWSVAEMDDGTFVNRWPKDHRRHKPAEKFKAAIELHVRGLITTRLAEMAA